MSDVRTENIVLWFIENYSFCWHRNGETLISPEFTVDFLKGSIWTLKLYPRAYRKESQGYMSLFLNRSLSDSWPENSPLKYELAFLAADGSSLKSFYCEYTFQKGYGYGISKAIKLDTILKRKADFLPQDTLTVRCRILKGEGSICQINEVAFRTRIGIEQVSFNHVIESFSTLKANEKETLEIRSLENKRVLTGDLYFIDDSSDGEIIMRITSSSENKTLSQCKVFIVDSADKRVLCVDADNRFYATRKDISKMSLTHTRKILLIKKSEYLPEDKLSLACECIFSTGVEYKKTEKIRFGTLSIAVNRIKNDIQNQDIYNAAEKLSECTAALDDLKSMYNNQLLTDVIIETKTKSFPAHKNWLCARSPVFKAMLTTDMREKNGCSIPIDDLEDDTVEQFLLFLYIDKLEDLNWESAVKLYYAGDKYQIEKLKVVCAAFLVDHVNTSLASELLVLADTHNDSYLKEAVEDFILRHEEQVYGSEEWEKLAVSNPSLVTKTMLLKYKKN